MPPRVDPKIKALSEIVKAIEKELKDIKLQSKPIVDRPSIKIKTDVELKHAFISPDYTGKTVITDSVWDYVEVFLQKEGTPESKDAIMYWLQAKNFCEATNGLSLTSAPLTTYYCFLNATKALLTYKKVQYKIKHGVTGRRSNIGHCLLQNEFIKIKPQGILSGLMTYLEEDVSLVNQEFSLKDIFYNLPYIHRTFQLSMKDAAYPELFMPIRQPRFVFDKGRKAGWFEAKLLDKYTNKSSVAKISGFGMDRYYSKYDDVRIRRNKNFKWDTYRNNPDQSSKDSFNKYYKKIRARVQYVYDVDKYWFVKRTDLKHNINVNILITTYAAMHRLSELARYQPNILHKHFEKPHSWLLREFIRKSMPQFIDGVASEITGSDFRK